MRTFGDLLDFTRDNTLRDASATRLWDDAELAEYIAQAHDEFAERTLSIRDSTSSAASFLLEAGVSMYTLHEAVQAVLSAKVEGAQNNLIRIGSPAIDGWVPPPDNISWLERINNGTIPDGTPEAFTTDVGVDGGGQAVMVRVWPTPATADDGVEVKMRVARLPMVVCSLDTLNEEVECPRPYMMGLCHGAAAIAYTAQDADGEDPARGDRQRRMFEGYIARAISASKRKMFQPLAWGFGRGGFSHSR